MNCSRRCAASSSTGIDRSIDNCISKLRRKFDDPASEKIKTVWGEGYLFSPSAWNE